VIAEESIALGVQFQYPGDFPALDRARLGRRRRPLATVAIIINWWSRATPVLAPPAASMVLRCATTT
jgi:hypothetical protein